MELNRDLLYLFFKGNATFDEEIKIRKWLEESDDHYREFLQERKLFDAILLQGDVNNINRKKNVFRISWRSLALKVAGVAAIALLAMTITTVYWKESMKDEPMNTIVVPQGQRVNLTLADGTNVWLNAKTKMEYPQSFRAFDKRIVKVDGEAYFEVTKNPKIPFIVKTSRGEIEVMGTKFYVSDYSGTEEFETSLIEGKVMVRTPNRQLFLFPKDKAVLKNGNLIREKIDDMDIYRWCEGLYCFKEQTFDEVLKQFEVYYDIHFVRENEHIPNPKISGKFRLVDGVDYALKVLQREIQFTYRRDSEMNIIYLK